MLKFYFEDGLLPHLDSFFKNHVNHQVVDQMQDCDFVISAKINIGEYSSKVIQKAINSYKDNPKKIIIFLISDTSKKFNLPINVLLFRTSLLKSRINLNEFVLPYIFEKRLDFHILDKSTRPKIGFCGQTQHNIGKRKTCMKFFEQNKIFETDFIERNGFWNGKPNDEHLKKEFEDNIYQNHFNLANKGRGNFSIRFYQVLSAGRIPVVLDTDVVLPFADEIDYKKHIIISKSPRRLAEKVFSFYQTHTNEEMIALQKRNYQLYQDFFTFEGYGKKLEHILLNFEPKSIVKNWFYKFFPL
jgi:hypothetical protein